jgi:hypothetical protein
MRSNGLNPSAIIGNHPELRRVGLAEAFKYAADNRPAYDSFFESDGTLRGPGFTDAEASGLPEHLRSLRGVVTT